jgi:hypothetical protein
MPDRTMRGAAIGLPQTIRYPIIPLIPLLPAPAPRAAVVALRPVGNANMESTLPGKSRTPYSLTDYDHSHSRQTWL